VDTKQKNQLNPFIRAFLIAALNGLEILAGGVPTNEHGYTIAGPEFGSDNEGRPVMIVRA
jgi:hypothetical protein